MFEGKLDSRGRRQSRRSEARFAPVRSRRRIGTVAAVAAVTLLVPAAGTASAATVLPAIADGLAGPLGLSVAGDGTIYVSQSFSGTLTRIAKDGTTSTVAQVAGEIAGVSAESDGGVVFTTLTGTEEAPRAALRRVSPTGDVRTLAHLRAYEWRNNPDANVAYGFSKLPAGCAELLPPEIGPARYRGIIDSHPYAVVSMPNGSRIVADAAGNDLIRVSPKGHLSTLAVLPKAAPVLVTAENAAATGLPECTIGATYSFEAVPTDVELGPDGMLYVSTLPGGPEDPSLGARGSVYRVNPATGAVRRIATGFAGATGLAIGAQGRIYVAELFGNKISYVKNGAPELLVSLTQPAAVEFFRGNLYATSDVFGSGKVVKIDL